MAYTTGIQQTTSTSNFMIKIIITTFITITLCISPTQGFFGEWGPDLAGPWCATRPPGQDCCEGRDDICAVPILGTECYCDIFCNESAYDCCPDYWTHCHGIQNYTHIKTTPTTTLPPPRSTRPTPPQVPCFSNGKMYMPGDVIQENCNNCTCEFHEFTGSQFMCTDEVCLMRPDLIEDLNNGNYTWKASNYSKFWGQTLDDGVRFRLGTFLLQGDVLRMTPLRVQDDVLPESFDARDKWHDLLHPITDQGNCASSWAHSTTAVASDRLAIETEGIIQAQFSPQHLLSCNKDKQLGCQGGHLDRAWWYLWKHGVVAEECYPYVSGKNDKAGTCLITKNQKGGLCPSGIEHKSNARYKATPPYRIRPLEREIMKEIMDNGPVQATILVREDFFMYNRGIYSYSGLAGKQGEPERFIKSGFHSVRIIGWGAERTVEGDIIKYWLCANSWGREWGEEGYFRIVRGNDESRIERYVVGVWGKISGDSFLRGILLENRRRRLRGQRARRQLRHLITRRERRRRRTRRHNRHRSEHQGGRRRHRRHHHRQDRRRGGEKSKKKHSKKNKEHQHKSSKSWKHKKGNKNNKNKNKHFSQFYNSVNLEGLQSFFPGFKH